MFLKSSKVDQQAPQQRNGGASGHPNGNEPPPPAYQNYPVQPYPIVQPYPARPMFRESPGWRFCRAFTAAILIWMLLSIFVQSLVSLAHWNHGQNGWGSTYPIPANIEVDRCVGGRDGSDWSNQPFLLNNEQALGVPLTNLVPESAFPLSSTTSFELPLSANALFLISRGPLSSGTVDVVTSPTQRDVVRVHVEVKYFRTNVRDLLKACLVRQKGGEYGVGIFSPENRWRGRWGIEEHLFVHTTVVLPTSKNGLPLRINRFKTDVPNTVQTLDKLAGSVDFRSIFLRGSNAAINVNSLKAFTADIRTSNSPIQGIFNISDNIVLHTSNAPIKVDVGLNNTGKNSIELKMETSNNILDAAISLFSESKSTPGGAFDIRGRTSNGPLKISFPTAPVGSLLSLEARTSNSPALVTLHPTYEGTFNLHTSNNAAQVHEDPDVQDPSGQKRQRVVKYSVRKTTVEGSVYWSKIGERKNVGEHGKVDVRTSNSPLTLNV